MAPGATRSDERRKRGVVTVSIIIPTFNEASCLAETLRLLRAERPGEIIVVDGGSTDGTCELARSSDRLLEGTRGRAAQMNQGAAEAHGDVLLFLHADCLPELGSLQAVERCLDRPGVAAGCFRMTVQADGWAFRMIGSCATARVRLTGLIYGDQGLFVKRKLFERIGGFPALRFMEDVFISKMLLRHGRMAVLDKKILVSPRRWQRMGVIRQTLHNWALTALALAGVHPDRLARFYPAVR
jgi:rSAM/selenodomain-associated transferase 2